jgi:outer membrane protein assembly factor BamB
LFAGDWPDWRGPRRDGVSTEKNLPSDWSPAGKNLLWKAPYGARSAPIVLGDHVYLQTAVGKGATLQERLLCFHAGSGKLLWEHRVNLFHGDVPPHRIAWASPVADPATGHVYMYTGHGALLALTKDGKPLWERSLAEEFGVLTTHGGRTVSPIIDGDLVITSALAFGWGVHAGGAHRFLAFDKKNGALVWMVASPGRPTDTVYSSPIIENVHGTRLMIVGSSDGGVHAYKPQTGELVWSFFMSKRGVNTNAVFHDGLAIVTHSEENLETNEMGMLAALDAAAKGPIPLDKARWKVYGVPVGFASPVIHEDRIYLADNSANLLAHDFKTGKELWKKTLGTIQKASVVLGDGKLYVGTENGKFFILKPAADRCEVLSEQEILAGSDPLQILGSVAIANGRVYLTAVSPAITEEWKGMLFAIGKPAPAAPAARPAAETPSSGAPAALLVYPGEVSLKPGESARFQARLYDAQGRFLREEKAQWSLERLGGQVQDGAYTAPAENKMLAGLVKATASGVSGAARVRIFPPPPWSEDFESYPPGPPPPAWINTTNKYEIRDLNGNKVLVKQVIERPFHKRARSFFGPIGLSNYTVQADFQSAFRRRQLGDAGVVAQRYQLVIFGNHDRLELQSWQPETLRTVTKPFPLKPDTWFRMKLEVQNLPDGKTRARGKVWPAAEPEPAAWMIERLDPPPHGNRQGSPGIYGDALSELFFDNIKVTPNR